MNAVRRTVTISAAALVAAASTIPLAGSAAACEIVVDSYTGSTQCLDVPQPATGLSITWLWIGLAVALAAAATLLMARRRPLKRLPAPTPLNANEGESSELHTTGQARIPTPRIAEAEGQRGPVDPEKLPSSR
jgi:H+/Cl- antiporter ClcA